MSQIATWHESGSGTAALATATKAANANQAHKILRVHASYSAAQIGTLTVKEGSTTVFTGAVHNQRDVELGYQGKANAAVSAELSAGAAGVIGRVHISGL